VSFSFAVYHHYNGEKSSSWASWAVWWRFFVWTSPLNEEESHPQNFQKFPFSRFLSKNWPLFLWGSKWQKIGSDPKSRESRSLKVVKVVAKKISPT
jgi:hypothetical protein